MCDEQLQYSTVFWGWGFFAVGVNGVQGNGLQVPFWPKGNASHCFKGVKSGQTV